MKNSNKKGKRYPMYIVTSHPKHGPILLYNKPQVLHLFLPRKLLSCIAVGKWVETIIKLPTSLGSFKWHPILASRRSFGIASVPSSG